MSRPERDLTESLMDGDAWLTSAEVAPPLRVDAKTVTRWAARGWFPDMPDGRPGVMRTPGGGRWLIRRSVVVGLMDGSLTPREVAPDGDDD
jgi:hypothetical protein